ncbi:MAG: tetratricopeptide repeat protein [Bacteroidales bacterium]|nr:tetratricopeptide repeat protein [Bacteroidales bacterium]
MKKTLSTIFLGFIISVSLFANENIYFQNANDAYNNGNYEQAIEVYDSLISTNTESANIYYNMGNAYYKLDNIPKAILYYEKARKIEPNNTDIIYNIELANTHIADKVEIIPEFFLKTIYINLRNSFSEKQWTTINIILFIIMLVFVITFFTINRKKQLWFSIAIVFLILTFVSGFIGYDSYKEKTTHNSAIVFTPTIDIKSAPDNKSSTIFILHQGTKIFLLEKSAKWQKIRIASGSEGWLKIDNFEEI